MTLASIIDACEMSHSGRLLNHTHSKVQSAHFRLGSPAVVSPTEAGFAIHWVIASLSSNGGEHAPAVYANMAALLRKMPQLIGIQPQSIIPSVLALIAIIRLSLVHRCV